VGSIVLGKLADFTILVACPLKADPVRIKDIPVWGMVHDGRVLPVRRASGRSGISKLRPVPAEGTLRAIVAEVPEVDALRRTPRPGRAAFLHSDLQSSAKTLSMIQCDA